MGSAEIGRLTNHPRMNTYELIYGSAYLAPTTARKEPYADSGFQTASHDTRRKALARAKVEASMTTNKYRNAASRAGYVICAESRDEMIVHSERCSSAVQLDTEGNLLEGDIKSKSLTNIYGATGNGERSEAAVTREVSLQHMAIIDNAYGSGEPATDDFVVYDAGAENNGLKVARGSTNTSQAKRKADDSDADASDSVKKTSVTHNDSPYALSKITIRDILGQVNTHNYNNTLPSSTATISNGQHQATVSGDITDKSLQSAPTSAQQDCRSDEGSEPGISDPEDDSEARSLSPSSVHDYGDETFPYDQFLNTTYDSTCDHSDKDIDSTSEGSSEDDCGEYDDDDENRSGYYCSSGPSNLLRYHVDDPQGASTSEILSYVFAPTIVGDPRPGSTQTNANQEARREEGQLNEVSEAPILQQEAIVFAQEPRLVPTTLHYRAIEQFDTADLIAPINELLKQNSARFNDFFSRRQAYLPTTFTPKRAKPGPPIKTTFSHAWYNQVELKLLTEAIKWLDKLLARFRAAVIHEDVTSLQPRIEQAVRDHEATGVPSKVRSGEPLTITDQKIARRFTDSVIKIKASNPVRQQLFGHIDIDVSTFENLLSSAENIRCRRDFGREYVGLSERDSIEQPEQPHKITHPNDMYYPYELLDRPEIFDHPSAGLTTLSSTGVTGSQVAGQQLPMRQGYYQELSFVMMGTIAAQRDDEVGKIKIGKRAESMSRDWEAFYNLIYGSDMANYTKAASLRIEEEAREEMRRKARVESLQDDSRRSSTEGSDASVTSIELILPIQGNETPPKKGSKFCMKVNKPGGLCKKGDNCTLGAERCAFRHGATSGTGSVPSPPTQPRGGSVGRLDQSLLDLRVPQILLQALANPKAFKVYTLPISAQGVQIWYVATTIHWKATFAMNTWKVTVLGACCVLLLKKPYSVPPGPGRSSKGAKRPDLTIDPKPDTNDVQPNNRFQSDAQRFEPMDHTQTLEDVHLDPQTPIGLKIWREAAQPGRAQHPPFNHATDKGNISQVDRKRRHSSGRIPWRGGDFVDWMTAEDGHPIVEVLPRILRDRREDEIPMGNFSDYPNDNEVDTNESLPFPFAPTDNSTIITDPNQEPAPELPPKDSRSTPNLAAVTNSDSATGGDAILRAASGAAISMTKAPQDLGNVGELPTAPVTQRTSSTVIKTSETQSEQVLCTDIGPSQPSSEGRSFKTTDVARIISSELSGVTDQSSDTRQKLSSFESGYSSLDDTNPTPGSALKGLQSAEPEIGGEPGGSTYAKFVVLPEVICFGNLIRSDQELMPHILDLISNKMDELSILPKPKRLRAIKGNIRDVRDVIEPFNDTFSRQKDISGPALAWQNVADLQKLLCYLLLLDMAFEPWQDDIEHADQQIVSELRKYCVMLLGLEKRRDDTGIAQVQAEISKAKTSNNLRNFVSKKIGLKWAMFEQMMANAEHLLYGDD
ncbi:hypothetical protein E8E11_006848 [Didymella keratinophila]|nr:hypothetical protein E8E11_006848 [Didymella keratinophila]